MRVAQSLYENGYITYMRTDNPALSQEGTMAAREAAISLYGSEFVPDKARYYSAKSTNAQEAHEAIRPAGEVFRTPEETGLSGRELDLYTLIWKRTLASQMKNAQKLNTTVLIDAQTNEGKKAVFATTGIRIVFPGFIRVYVEGSDDPDAALEDKESLLTDEDERAMVSDLHLITMKPVIYVCNIDENSIGVDNEYVKTVRDIAAKRGSSVVTICGKIEAEIAEMDSPEDRAEFLADMGLEESGMNALIREAYATLGLRTFFTAGPDEDRAWTFKAGYKAPQAAGVIHTDFEKGFIKAEVYSCEDLFKYGSEAKVKEAGKLRIEGKDYVVQDGDVMFFRFNV